MRNFFTNIQILVFGTSTYYLLLAFVYSTQEDDYNEFKECLKRTLQFFFYVYSYGIRLVSICLCTGCCRKWDSHHCPWRIQKRKFRCLKIYSVILFRPMSKKNVVFNGARGWVRLKQYPGALRWWVVEAAGVWINKLFFSSRMKNFSQISWAEHIALECVSELNMWVEKESLRTCV